MTRPPSWPSVRLPAISLELFLALPGWKPVSACSVTLSFKSIPLSTVEGFLWLPLWLRLVLPPVGATLYYSQYPALILTFLPYVFVCPLVCSIPSFCAFPLAPSPQKYAPSLTCLSPLFGWVSLPRKLSLSLWSWLAAFHCILGAPWVLTRR